MSRIKSLTFHSSICDDHLLTCSMARALYSRPPSIMLGTTQVPLFHSPQEYISPPHFSHSASLRSQTLPQALLPPEHSVSLRQNSFWEAMSVPSHSPSAVSQATSVSIV